MSELTPDLRLIRHWGTGWRPAMQFPFIARFNHASGQLHYIAAEHQTGLDSATLKTIRYEFELFKPDLVVIEGVPHAEGLSPQRIIDAARKQADSDFQQCNESLYAAYLAHQNKIDFIGGEPTNKEIFESMRKQGISEQDIVGWNITRNLKYKLERKLLPEEYVEQEITGYGYNPALFKTWYAEHFGEDFSIRSIIGLSQSPSAKPEANFLQRMSYAADQIREPQIVGVITAPLNRGKKVLAVYGGAHQGKHEPVFKKMLGKPRYFKPFKL